MSNSRLLSLLPSSLVNSSGKILTISNNSIAWTNNYAYDVANSAYAAANSASITLQSVQTANFTAVAGRSYPVNTSNGAITVTLPSSPTAGQQINIFDYAGTASSNNIIINPNGGNINGIVGNSITTVARASVTLIYVDSSQGWIGVTIGNAGYFKRSYSSAYLIAAGGGGGCCGGGGGGGLLSGTVLLTPSTTYTVTVGGGGSGIEVRNLTPSSGSPSSFFTFSSLGGGGGGSGFGSHGASGGSGGGGSNASLGGSGASGQGNAGGNGGGGSYWQSGGGGGSGAAGQNTSGDSTAGGVGSSSTITGTSIFYSGGGGGGGDSRGSTGKAGGTGGGGGGLGQYKSGQVELPVRGVVAAAAGMMEVFGKEVRAAQAWLSSQSQQLVIQGPRPDRQL